MQIININEMSSSELMLLMACRLLTITKHSKEFVEEQRQLISSMSMNNDAKKLCLQTLDSVETND